MTAYELIRRLTDFPPDAEVFIFADHGQDHENVTVVEMLGGEDAYYRDLSDSDDPRVVVAVIHGL